MYTDLNFSNAHKISYILLFCTSFLSGTDDVWGGANDTNPLNTKHNLHNTQFVRHRQHSALWWESPVGDGTIGKQLTVSMLLSSYWIQSKMCEIVLRFRHILTLAADLGGPKGCDCVWGYLRKNLLLQFLQWESSEGVQTSHCVRHDIHSNNFHHDNKRLQ